jgi:hypothetical protein
LSFTGQSDEETGRGDIRVQVFLVNVDFLVDEFNWIFIPKFEVFLFEAQQREYDVGNQVGNMRSQKRPGNIRLDAFVSCVGR